MDAGIGGIGPVLPPWPCIQQDLDCVKKDGTNILNITTVYPYISPYIQDMKCNGNLVFKPFFPLYFYTDKYFYLTDFRRKTEGCEFWTIA